MISWIQLPCKVSLSHLHASIFFPTRGRTDSSQNSRKCRAGPFIFTDQCRWLRHHGNRLPCYQQNQAGVWPVLSARPVTCTCQQAALRVMQSALPVWGSGRDNSCVECWSTPKAPGPHISKHDANKRSVINHTRHRPCPMISCKSLRIYQVQHQLFRSQILSNTHTHTHTQQHAMQAEITPHQYE